eukprot:1152801-Pelagomonas_calceolata.AAC.5
MMLDCQAKASIPASSHQHRSSSADMHFATHAITHRVHHLHDANGSCTQEAHGHHGLLHQHQHVNGVAILAQRLGHKAIVVGVHHRAVQDAVHK